HEDLYAGGASFHTDDWGDSFRTGSHHGYWMARTLKEVAPGVEVFALGTYSSDEDVRVDSMIRAIDWAIEHGLDVLTYSARRFSEENRVRLDEAVDRALANGISTTFIHYPHPGNILPSWLGPRSGDDDREADLNILQYDYSVVFTGPYAEWMEKGPESGYRPFLSISSTSPVAAGAVAILKSIRPDLKPEQLKELLMETAYETEFQGMTSRRTMDVRAAVEKLAGGGERP
ncbi:MAG TPA: S8/S53 family peptidase, partial [Candidatus Krumholzibacterium sp.]|nr:S8/S53 family peptidase [Candidatus Krumholzibacterium sp.]